MQRNFAELEDLFALSRREREAFQNLAVQDWFTSKIWSSQPYFRLAKDLHIDTHLGLNLAEHC